VISTGGRPEVVPSQLAYDLSTPIAAKGLSLRMAEAPDAEMPPPYTSHRVSGREGVNPKGIKDWADLVKSGRPASSRRPNPKPSGRLRGGRILPHGAMRSLKKFGSPTKANEAVPPSAKSYKKEPCR